MLVALISNVRVRTERLTIESLFMRSRDPSMLSFNAVAIYQTIIRTVSVGRHCFPHPTPIQMNINTAFSTLLLLICTQYKV